MNRNPTEPRPQLNAFLLVLALVPCALCAGFAQPVKLPALKSQRPPSPLTFASLLYHHGDEPVAPAAVLESEFRFRNDGPETIRFDHVETSCGCLRPRFSKLELAPGDVGSLVVPLSTINQAPGLQEYTLVMHYADPKPRRQMLTIKAKFPEKMVVVEPNTPIYVSNRSSAPADFDVRISDFRNKTLTVRDVSSSAAFVTAEVIGESRPKIVQASFSSTEVAPQSVTKLKGQVSGGVPAGNHFVVLSAVTNDAEIPVITVPVVVNGPAYPDGRAAKATPSEIHLVAAKHPAARKSAKVSITTPIDWNISHANAWPEQLKVEYGESHRVSETSKVTTLTVELTAIPPEGINVGVVQLGANDGKNLVTARVVLYRP